MNSKGICLFPRHLLKPIGLITGLYLVVVTMPVMAEKAAISFTGTAFDENEEPIYKESHEVTGSCRGERFTPQSHSVTYRRAGSGETMGTKELDFKESVLRPSFTMEQTAFNETMTVTNDSDESVAIRWQDPEGEVDESTLEISDDMVFDSGFVHLIEKNWRKLNNGESVSFRFLSSTRAKTYGFVAKPTDDARIDAHLTLRMEPSGTILNWVVDPIILGFDEKGRLTHYLGLTNVRKSSDEHYRATIRYDLPELPCALVEKTQ